jgi:hypothetical protein
MKAKKITIDDLALMVSKGFTETREYIDSRLQETEARFDEKLEEMRISFDEKLEEMKEELFFIRAELSKRVDKFSHKDLELRLEKLEAKFKKYEKLLAQKV